jgi:hypothetical protein
MTTRNKEAATPKTPMSAEAAARIQRATAKANDGVVGKRSFAARAQRAAAKGAHR